MLWASARIRPSPVSLSRSYARNKLSDPRRYSAHDASRDGRPLRMAIIGSGPAGLYTAYRVMDKVTAVKVDVYEALPVPFGLVRFGVAPDHPEVKKCQEKLSKIASSPDLTFLGNISIGEVPPHQAANGAVTVPLATLLRHYDAAVFAYGAAVDRLLGVPGEASLQGIYSGREFVGWYNGLPEHAVLTDRIASHLTVGGDEAVVIGQGNVALDVARMLLEDVDVLRKTDMAEHALQVLAASKVRRVRVVGRRGPMQAAFTTKELRELMKLRDTSFQPLEGREQLLPEDLQALPRVQRRLMQLLVKGSDTPVADAGKTWCLDFCRNPTAFIPGLDEERVAFTEVEATTLSDPLDPNAAIVGGGSGKKTRLPSSIVFRSIGYKSVPLPGFADLGISFDGRRGVIANDAWGRVLQAKRTPNAAMTTVPFPGLYCAGWVKRGPTGVLLSTMADAFATGDALAQDWAEGAPFLGEKGLKQDGWGWDGVRKELEKRGSTACVVQWSDWERIDQAERRRGQEKGKEREKFVRTTDMLAAIA